MADLEEYFISCLLRSREWQPVVEARITVDHFDDAQHARVFEFIQKHISTHGEVPLPHMVRRNWPSYRLVKVEHGIAYYIEEMRSKFLFGQIQLVLADMQAELDDNRDPQAALKIMQSVVGDLSLLDTVMVDIDLNATYEERLEQYEEYRENQGSLRGISTGFKTLDKATLGLWDGQFIMGIGLPKAGKSSLLLALGKAAHDAGEKVLLINFEMSNEEQGARYDAMVAKVDHLRLLSGDIGTRDIRRIEAVAAKRQAELNEEQGARYDAMVAKVDHLRLLSGDIGTRDIRRIEAVAAKRQAELNEFISTADIANTTTVSGIVAKIKQHQPGLVLVDGVYLMDDEHGEPKGSPAALTNISRGLRRVAQLEHLPLVGISQALHSKVSRVNGLTASSAGYTSAFAQDAHLMLGIEAVEDEENIQRIKVLASRIGPRVEFEVRWDWKTGEFEEIEDGDIEVDV